MGGLSSDFENAKRERGRVGVWSIFRFRGCEGGRGVESGVSSDFVAGGWSNFGFRGCEGGEVVGGVCSDFVASTEGSGWWSIHRFHGCEGG